MWRSTGDAQYGFLTTQILGGAVQVGQEIWVSNPRDQNILVVDRTGTAKKTVGRGGPGPGEFGTVAGIAVDPSGHVAIYDVGKATIHIFDTSGNFRDEVPLAIRVWNPKGFVATNDGFVISGAVMGRDHAIYRVDRNGELVSSWYPLPEATDPELDPRIATSNVLSVAGGALGMTPDGGLIFSAAAPHEILRFPPGSTQGELLAQEDELLPSAANTFTRLEYPDVYFDWLFPQSRGVYALPDGSVLNIVTFDTEGRGLWQLYERDGTPRGRGEVAKAYLPWSMTKSGTVLASYIDSANDEVYVAELRWTER